jgi:putative flippase GtrA
MGVVAFSLNIFITVALHEWLGAPAELAFAVALVVVFLFGFLSGRYMIFEGAAYGDPKKQFGRFVLISVGFRLAQFVGFLVLHTLLRLPYLAAVVAVLGVAFLTKFFTYGTVVFVDDREVS